MTHFTKGVLFTVLFLGLMPQIVAVGSMPYVSIDNLWDYSEVAVHGNVTSIQLSVVGGFYRIVEIDVYESFIQHLGESTVKIRVEGGEFGGFGHWVEDQPEFEVGENVFVFLRSPEEIKGDYEYVVYAMWHGKFSVDGLIASQDNGRSFQIPIIFDKSVGDKVKPYTGIEFQKILTVALGIVVLSIFIVWLLTPNPK